MMKDCYLYVRKRRRLVEINSLKRRKSSTHSRHTGRTAGARTSYTTLRKRRVKMRRRLLKSQYRVPVQTSRIRHQTPEVSL